MKTVWKINCMVSESIVVRELFALWLWRNMRPFCTRRNAMFVYTSGRFIELIKL